MANKKLYFDSTHEIPLSIDSYDDIFSDFDPRPYRQRALSDDFLNELKRASYDKGEGVIEIKLILPKRRRNLKEEVFIKKRLIDHFKKHFNIHKKDMEHLKKQGFNFIIGGLLLMIAATSIVFYSDSHKSFLTMFLIVFLEPGGWFLFWEGLNLVIFEAKKKKPDYEFYEKMSKSKIHFLHH